MRSGYSSTIVDKAIGEQTHGMLLRNSKRDLAANRQEVTKILADSCVWSDDMPNVGYKSQSLFQDTYLTEVSLHVSLLARLAQAGLTWS